MKSGVPNGMKHYPTSETQKGQGSQVSAEETEPEAEMVAAPWIARALLAGTPFALLAALFFLDRWIRSAL